MQGKEQPTSELRAVFPASNNAGIAKPGQMPLDSKGMQAIGAGQRIIVRPDLRSCLVGVRGFKARQL